MDASQLNLCDNVVDLSGYTATDPNVQYMGGLMSEADEAQHDNNLDGSNQIVDVTESESTSSDSGSDSSSDSSSDSTESDSAA